MYANFDNKTKQVNTFATWEEFVPHITLYYQCDTKTECYMQYDGEERCNTLPVYKGAFLLDKPHPYVKISDAEHLKIVEMVKRLFETHHIIMITNPEKLFHANNLNLSELFNCVDDNQRNSLLKQFKQGIKRSNHLVGVVHFMIQHLSNGENILSAVYESFVAKKPEDKGTIMLKTINRQLNITEILNELE